MVLRAFIVVSLLFTLVPLGHARDKDHPNILLIVADDLGYSDVGVFGS